MIIETDTDTFIVNNITRNLTPPGYQGQIYHAYFSLSLSLPDPEPPKLTFP
jgi:hypothetical protein